jgi:hypothetical protein
MNGFIWIIVISKMITIASTRFSNTTLEQNMNYRTKYQCCVYGSPQEMSPKILPDSLVFMIEMNNDTNKIEGVGLMHNRPLMDKYYKIYTDGNYNRYVYKSKYHVSRETLLRFNQQLVQSLDYVLFKEKTHLKRGSGFVTVPDKLLFHEKCNGLNVMKELKTIFASVFDRSNKEDPSLIDRINSVS